MNMSKKISAFFMAVIFIFSSIYFKGFSKQEVFAAEVGVFYNGNLEQGTEATPFTDWDSYSYGSAFSVSTTENHTVGGSRCIKIEPIASIWSSISYVGIDNSSTIPVTQNAVYRVSFWHKGSANGQLQVADYGIPKQNIPVNNDANWTLYTKDFHVGTRTFFTPMDLKNNNSNVTTPSYFDDFKIEMITPPVTPNPMPPPGIMETLTGKTGSMKLGSNFWFHVDWSGETPIKQNVNWATAYANGDDIWNPTFISELAPYVDLRFMDWGNTNNSTITTWSQRRLPTDPNNYFLNYDVNDAGIAYEWMIDLCNDPVTPTQNVGNFDYNNNGIVDIKDLNSLATNYNLKSSDSKWNLNYDLNGDKIIDIFDLVKISKSLGK